MSRTHSNQKHLSVCLITIGIIMCTFESAKTLENQSNFIDWSIGIVMLSTSLVLSALMGVNQERIFAKWGKHYQEALFFTVIIYSEAKLTINSKFLWNYNFEKLIFFLLAFFASAWLPFTLRRHFNTFLQHNSCRSQIFAIPWFPDSPDYFLIWQYR